MADKWRKQFDTFEGPASDGFVASANSTNVFTQPTRALYVGSGGTVCVQMLASTNTVLTFTNVANGTLLPIRASIVFANSTANGFVGLF